jgi:FKBP-type peptidyl-prolyl cis-trans isomerase
MHKMKRLPIALLLLAVAMQACFKNEDPNLEVKELLEKQNFKINQHLEGKDSIDEDANGVFREVLIRNAAGEEVETGDVAEVEYKITQLDGTLIGENPDTTMRVGYVKSSEIGQSTVYAPLLMYHALQYMREGEKFRFYAPFTFGYNNYELENVIPYRSIVVLELEIKELHKTTEELLASDVELIEDRITEKEQEADTLASGIRKVLLTAGEGEQADEDDLVGVYYTGSFLTGTVFDTNTKAGSSLFSFTIGAGNTIPGFEKAILSMKKGEKSIFYLPSREAYDNAGWYVAPEAVRVDLKNSGQGGQLINIPPHSPLVFEIELKELTKK